MILGKMFEHFVRESPVTVMLRGVMEYALPKARTDELFREHAEDQRENELLFSTVVEVLAEAVTRKRASVNASYLANAARIPVSVKSLYNKLN